MYVCFALFLCEQTRPRIQQVHARIFLDDLLEGMPAMALGDLGSRLGFLRKRLLALRACEGCWAFVVTGQHVLLSCLLFSFALTASAPIERR